MDYIIPQVYKVEYDTLKLQEAQIIKTIYESFNDFHRPRMKQVKDKFTFKYNNKRSFIGIFLKQKDVYRLMINDKKLSEDEKHFALSLKTGLEKALQEIKMASELWE